MTLPYEGRGWFIYPQKLEVDGQILTSERFIITTGSSPRTIPFPGIELVGYLTNSEALALKELPRSMIVIGTGPLGMEFAQMFSHFGTEVTVLARGPRVLRREEPEVSEELQRSLEEEGITVHTDAQVEELREEDGLIAVKATIAGKRQILKAEKLLMATGVVPNIAGLGLEEARGGAGPEGRDFGRWAPPDQRGAYLRRGGRGRPAAPGDGRGQGGPRCGAERLNRCG